MHKYLKVIRVQLLVALFAILLCSACAPLKQVVANCEVHGQITMQGTGDPVENVMIFVRYNFKASSVKPIFIGPILSDTQGRFVIPSFQESHWYIEHFYMGDCGGDILFVHPTLGSYTVLMCTEDFPPTLLSKQLQVSQRGIDSKHPMKDIIYSYTVLDDLPQNIRAIALAHMSVEMREKFEKLKSKK